MNLTDPVLARLAELAPSTPTPVLSPELQQRAHARLRARPVHPVWTLAVAASSVIYLGWAVYWSLVL